MKKFLLFKQETTATRLVAALSVVVTTLLFATTISEFAIALHNRYSVYPPGTDTNMYANSGILAVIFCLAATLFAVKVIYRKLDFKALSIGVFLFVILVWTSALVPSFIPTEWCKYELTIYPCKDYQDARSVEFWNNVIDNDNP